jgi:hypothetical protein
VAYIGTGRDNENANFVAAKDGLRENKPATDTDSM